MAASVLILTLDEEQNLGRCLASLAWCDDVVVLDSESTDGTVGIAREMGARVVERRFDDYANQRNFGLREIRYRHPWVLMVDADEVVSPELALEVKEATGRAGAGTCLFRLRRKDFFMGTWIRHSSGYPTWFGRLVKVGRVRIERAVNEEYLTDGGVGMLQGHLLHYPFNKGFHAWFDKHNRYSTMEGELLAKGQAGPFPWASLIGGDPSLRRKALKSVMYRMPGRPLLMFLGLYVMRGGFLDGRAGLTFCTLRSFYEFMIDCKAFEGASRDRNLPV